MPEKKPKLSPEEQFAYTIETHSMRKPHEWYTLNISPSVMRQHFLQEHVNTKSIGSIKKFNNYYQRQSLFHQEWKAIIRGWEFDGLIEDYILYLEVSDDGLLHYHGKVKIKNVKEFNHMLGIQKYFHQDVRIEVKPIVDDKWDEYMTKDHAFMELKIVPSNVKPNPVIKTFQGFTPHGES